jgi:long-subunit acyl-CoA synthetase (AMP-forming)
MQTVTATANKSSQQHPLMRPVIEFFYKWERETPNSVYLRQPTGDNWTEYTWKETGNQIRRMVGVLKAMNLPPQSNIGLVSKNCAHWIMADLAIMMAGHVSVPFYPTLTDDKIKEVLDHSGCQVLFIGKLDSWKTMKAGIGSHIRSITFPESPAEEAGFERWNDLIAKHEPYQENFVPNIHDLCTIIYTSGTTGTPKGVMHSYFTMASGAKAAIPVLHVGNVTDRFFSYLPLCHIAERQIVEVASLLSGGSISFVESLDTFGKNLADVQPTHFLAVPRIWTKFQQQILLKMPQKRLNLMLSLPIISGMVKKKIKKALGLSQAKLTLTGAAPMPPTLLKWFHKLGIHIQEAYGMTENNGACTLMRPDNVQIGTVGEPYPDCEIRIDSETQEILMKADWVMKGYHKDEEKSNETVRNGWLHTGDMGEFKNNVLKITGRVKDQFKTTKGEFIIPSPIEASFADNENIEQVCVLGRNLAQPVALVILSEIGKQKLAGEGTNHVEENIAQMLKHINKELPSYEKLQQVIICKEPWTIENNVLTPTLKIKRNILEDMFGSRLEKWFDTGKAVIWE